MSGRCHLASEKPQGQRRPLSANTPGTYFVLGPTQKSAADTRRLWNGGGRATAGDR